MSGKRSREPERVTLAKIDANVKANKNSTVAKITCTVLNVLKVLGVTFLVAGALVLCVRALAGQETNASILIKFLADIHFASYLAGGAGIAYGVRQRNSKRKYISENSRYTKELELQLNPDRVGSNIEPTGETKKEDRW